MKSRYMVPILGVTLGMAVIWGVTNAHAQNPVGYPNLVTKIAQRFNLNEQDVKAVFDETRSQHMQEMQVKFEEKLAKAVQEGKITEAQKQAILVKHQELTSQQQQTMAQFKTMTPQERKAAKEKMHTDLKSWAQTQGIDMENLFGLMHFKGMMRHKSF